MTLYPDWFAALIKTIKSKRPRIIAAHILQYGSITTEEITSIYGYNHAPRAIRDLRELGIPIETFNVRNSAGRPIAGYKFGNLSTVKSDRLTGRQNFPKAFKTQLIAQFGERCSNCNGQFAARYLQIDHRIPYEIIGDVPSAERDPANYQLLCAACNRAKSWSCEHCANWTAEHNPQICETCYWAQPINYTHIALQKIRRINIIWNDDEVMFYDTLAAQALTLGETMQDYIKRILRTSLADDKTDKIR